MKTEYWRVDGPDDSQIQAAGRILRGGGLVAFPTETVYGLGANGFDAEAVAGVYRAKGRPADNPLILHVSSVDEAKALTDDWCPAAELLARELWPGPLTLILAAKSSIPAIVTAGLDTVAVRYPSEPIALALIRAAGVPIAAPSANTSGKPSPTSGDHVLADLGGRIDVILDGGPCAIGIESTIVDLTVTPPVILRPGDITCERLSDILSEVRLYATSTVDPGSAPDTDAQAAPAPKAPGMKYRHYAPWAPVTVLEGEPEAIAQYIKGHIFGKGRAGGVDAACSDSTKVGLLLSEDTWAVLADKGISVRDADFRRHFYRDMGSRSKPEVMGRRLYDSLRACDREAVSHIYAEACTDEGRGAAVLNRLGKAASATIKCQDRES